MYQPQEPCPVCLEVTGCDCHIPGEPVLKKSTKPKSLSNWFGDEDEDFAVAEIIRKRGTLKGKRVG